MLNPSRKSRFFKSLGSLVEYKKLPLAN